MLIKCSAVAQSTEGHHEKAKEKDRPNLGPDIGETISFQENATQHAQEMAEGKASPMTCAHSGMPRKGNMNPESKSEGRKKKNDICMACS